MRNPVSRRGFNLIEIAIVLAVIGLVIGGIYVAASAVRENSRKQQALTQLLTLVQNIKNSYSTQPSLGGDPTPAQLQALGALPGDMTVSGSQVMGVYGQVLVSDNSAASTIPSMNVGLYGVPPGACTSIVLAFSANATASINQGICGMNVNGTGAYFVGTALTAGQAGTFCSQPQNQIDICFTLH